MTGKNLSDGLMNWVNDTLFSGVVATLFTLLQSTDTREMRQTSCCSELHAK